MFTDRCRGGGSDPLFVSTGCSDYSFDFGSPNFERVPVCRSVFCVSTLTLG